MRISGERVKRIRFIQTDKLVVAVDVELVYPQDDPSEPCYEAETIQHLREVQQHAKQGDMVWLSKNGKVYTAVEQVN